MDALVFVTLGYGGSLILSYDGAIPNEAGADIEVVETSYNNPGCASYPEYALVSVSVDGVNWSPSVQVCKGNNLVDISDLGDYDYVNYIRIENDDENTTTPDGFDLDGVRAIHNCVEDGDDDGSIAGNYGEADATLTSYPNPTNGISQVVFKVGTTNRTTIEVYDMSGRSVGTLFNQEAQAGEEYRLDFDGTSLPNGIYIYRMTTGDEVIMDKFMIAR
jgi:hypothetical protein